MQWVVHVIKAVIYNIAPRDRIKLTAKVWLIEFNGKGQELEERLGLAEGAEGNYFLASLGSVNGFVSSNLAQWLNQYDPNK